MQNDDLYIGYLDKAPSKFHKPLRWIVVGLIVLLVGVACLLAFSQREFSTSAYEFGTLTTVEGVISADPVPTIKVIGGKDLFGRPVYQTVLLVAYGKHGADHLVFEFGQLALEKLGKPLSEVKCRLEGTLAYNDGKAVLELTRLKESLLGMNDDLGDLAVDDLLPAIQVLGKATLTGEIIDPKCYFGAMKPGQGKPHRSCAVLCIAGGIPPVLFSEDAQGQRAYYLIRGKNGQAINQQVLDYVGEKVTIQGRVERYDDWYVVYADKITF